MTTPEVQTVLAWHAAANQGDVERLLALSSDDIEVGGPRGSDRGADLLREWLTRAGIHLTPGRIFARDEWVVVQQSARWPSVDGSPTDPREVASVFRVRHGRVCGVIRHSDL